MSIADAESVERTQRFARLTELPFVDTSKQGSGALRDIVRHREMLDLMVRRDLKARYKDSALGFVWTLVRPLTQLFVYYVVLGQFLGAARGVENFAIYIFAGLTIFTLFSEITLGGAGSIVANAGLVKKVYLPREIFPLASVGGALFNFVIQLVVLIIATVAFGAAPVHVDLWYAIPALAVILVYGTALALLLSAVNVYLRDIQYLIEVVIMLAMWASPIVYLWSMVSARFPAWLLSIYLGNPVTIAVLDFQRAFWLGGTAEHYPAGLALRSGIAFLVGLIVLYLCHRVFRRLQGDFAQEL